MRRLVSALALLVACARPPAATSENVSTARGVRALSGSGAVSPDDLATTATPDAEAALADASATDARSSPVDDAASIAVPPRSDRVGGPSVEDVAREGRAAYRCSVQGGDLYNNLFEFVRAESTPEGFSLVAQRTCDESGCKPFRRTTTISEPQWNALTRAFRTKHFDELMASSHWGFDGSTWKLEAAHDGTYHTVSEWSPHSGRFYELCCQLRALAGPEMRCDGR